MSEKTLGYNDILNFIRSKTPCSANLHFYGRDFPETESKTGDARLTACVTSFANSGGGLIVAGIKTIRNRANEAEPVTFNKVKFFRIDNIFRYEIQPEITGLKIYSVPLPENPSKGFVVIGVPDSPNRPHLASDNRFYHRAGTKYELMPETRIRELYNKASMPEMEFLGIQNTNGIPILENGKISAMTFYPKFLVRNSGNGLEKHFKFELLLPSVFHDAGFTPLQNYFNRLENSYSVFSIPNRNPVFQKEICNVAEAKIIVTSANFERYMDGKLIIRLYHSGGVKEFEYSLKEIFTYENKILQKSGFSDTIKKIL